MEKPFIKMMKLDAMDIVTASEKEDGLTIQSLTTAEDNKSIGF